MLNLQLVYKCQYERHLILKIFSSNIDENFYLKKKKNSSMCTHHYQIR